MLNFQKRFPPFILCPGRLLLFSSIRREMISLNFILWFIRMKLLVSAFRLKVSKEFLVLCSSCGIFHHGSQENIFGVLSYTVSTSDSLFQVLFFLDLFQSKPPSAVQCSCVISPQRRMRHWKCLGSILLGERFVSCSASPESEEGTLTS